MANITHILNEYDESHHLFCKYEQRLKDLVNESLAINGIIVHSVSSRVKSRDSLSKKFGKAGNNYSIITDITDIVGLRIITLFEDDVDIVAQNIRKIFDIDDPNSVDKRALLDPDRFGYLSLHYIVSLTDERCQLFEFEKFRGLKAEIQIRSILQHAWAEIEHDLGYKSTAAIPFEYRREFSRLAGLLEIADNMFCNIKNNLKMYEREVGEKIKNNPNSVQINLASIIEYIKSNELVKSIDHSIADYDKVSYDPEFSANNMVAAINWLGLYSISELNSALEDNEEKILPLYAYISKIDLDYFYETVESSGSVNAGTSIYMLLYIIAYNKNNLREYIKQNQIGIEEERDNFVDYITTWLNKN